MGPHRKGSYEVGRDPAHGDKLCLYLISPLDACPTILSLRYLLRSSLGALMGGHLWCSHCNLQILLFYLNIQ